MSSGPSAADELSERLRELASMLRNAGTPAFLTSALDTLAAGPGAHGHLTAIVGEKGRGKTTLVNRLLEANVLPVGRRGYHVPLVLTSGAAWQTVDRDGASAATELPIAPGLPLRSVAGPAALLAATSLLDTPPLNEAELDFEERVVAELVHADAFLICVAANQLLSQNERDVIRGRLLPLLGGDGALVVTHMDAIDTDEDRQEIRQRAQRFAGTKLAALFVPAEPSAPPGDVVRFITESVRRHATEQAVTWRSKVAALLNGMAQELEVTDDADGQDEPPPAPSRDDQIRDLTRLVSAEHSLALAEAESLLRQRLGALRAGLSARIAHWTPDYAQREGATEIAADLQTAMRDAASFYVSALERSLMSGAPRSVQLATDSVPRLGDTSAALAGPDVTPPARRRDLRVPGLMIAGIGLLFLPVTAAPVAGVAALVISHRLKRQRDLAFEQQVRSNALHALSSWIAAVELELIEQLRMAVGPVVAGLIARIESIVEVPPPARRASRRTELLAQLRACLALAQRPATSSSLPEVAP